MTVIVQASCVSEPIKDRLFLPIKNGATILEYLLRRINECGYQVIVATSIDKRDDAIVDCAQKMGVETYRADVDNTVCRLLECAKSYRVNNFVRVFANSPFVDTSLMSELYEQHIEGGYDYSYNEHLHGVLWGTGCDVFRTDFLEDLHHRHLSFSQIQTISAYIRQNSSEFNVYECQYYEKRPGYKLNLESLRDYEVIKEIADNVKNITCQGIADYLGKHEVLANYNLESPPKEAGLEKLFLSPMKTASILNKNFPDPTFPISVELTLTNACNMNCIYCSDAMLRARQGMIEQININDFKRLFDDLSKGGTKGVVLEGGGEPTLYSHFDEVVEYAKETGLAVGLITNGSQRLSESTLREFEWIRVSLDASTPSEYEAIKKVDFYERVIDNIAHYSKYCSTVGVGYVVTKLNISQIEPLVMRLRELGTSYIQLRPVVDCDDIYPDGVDLSYLKFYMTKEFGVQVDGMVENAYSGNHGLPCYANSITSIISGDGSVYICGRLNIYEWLKPIGNIREQSFSEIWDGEERRKQTEMIRDAEFCHKNCPQCRVSKFNVLFDKLYGIKSKHFI